MGVGVIEHATPSVAMHPDLADVPDEVVQECITNWKAPPDVVVTYVGYYRRYFITMMAVMPEERHGRDLSIYAEWDLCGFPDGTAQIQCACAALADVQVMDAPQQLLDYYHVLDFAPRNKTTESQQQFDMRSYALCHQIDTAQCPPEMIQALQREPVTLAAFNARHGLRADMPLKCFEE
jgi:hypothetical protein